MEFKLKWPDKQETRFVLSLDDKIKIILEKKRNQGKNKEAILSVVGSRVGVPDYYLNHPCSVISSIKKDFKKIARQSGSNEYNKLIEAGIIRKKQV